ncbi:head maturation protease, ClpP-related [Sansalvadorimonas verongulae]|uniref:head maturation protease, ClpP-related n=1 Tax=Sansalvadorimonas verongulae TaxID=2172824 RepID=UPI0012BC947F|nr:head maturation protease, ClpP-related [Sansalvadorimonas verongulae]MTI15140.1 Clp protease ClpP [Sansalvadorimonas verongulae]
MAKHNKPWFTLKNQADKPAELLIYDVIGDWQGLSAKELVNDLKATTSEDITVRINSPGGSVFDGIAIYNALRYHPANIHVRIEGLAASIASVIAMAGDTITMADNSLMMIHNPLGWVGGEAEDMRRTADMLDKATEAIALAYSGKSGTPVENITPLMASETWMTAKEAKAQGFIDVVDQPVQLAASLDLSMFNQVPDGLLPKPPVAQPPAQPVPQPAPQPQSTDQTAALAVVQLCNQAGYPELAETLLRGQASLDDVRQRLTDCETIKNLCAAAKSDQAANYIRSGKSVETVRTELFEVLVNNQQPIDNGLPPELQHKNTPQPSNLNIDSQALYQQRNKNAYR